MQIRSWLDSMPSQNTCNNINKAQGLTNCFHCLTLIIITILTQPRLWSPKSYLVSVVSRASKSSNFRSFAQHSATHYSWFQSLFGPKSSAPSTSLQFQLLETTSHRTSLTKNQINQTNLTIPARIQHTNYQTHKAFQLAFQLADSFSYIPSAFNPSAEFHITIYSSSYTTGTFTQFPAFYIYCIYRIYKTSYISTKKNKQRQNKKNKHILL